MINLRFPALACCLLLACATPGEEETPAPTDSGVPEVLAYDTLTLNDLSGFREVAANWSVAGEITMDMNEDAQVEVQDGKGILVNLPNEQNRENIATAFEHGDLEIHLDVMMPKGSNSGIYLQGRYEVQLFDSWGREEIRHADMGGIYQRWDESRPEGQQGFEGVAPPVNAARAPGLWQHFHILFRAPRFNESGEKVRNARFEFVDLNGMRLHENVELSGPTRAHQEQGEAAHGPLYFQGDHGPVAIRNIYYKRYEQDTLQLNDITYATYQGKWDFIPDFDTLTPVSTGDADFLDLATASNINEGYGAVFQGTLQVPKAGTYLFETTIDDGGDLLIDSQLVVHNQGEPGVGTERGLIDLTAGAHSFTMTFYQEVWSTTLLVHYEGPEISKRPLASFKPKPDWLIAEQAQPRLLLHSGEQPEWYRGFTMHGEEKLTHTISVGDPAGIHYSYDLLTGSLAKSWKGGFADVTDMWRGRGHSQLLTPLNASLLLPLGLPLAELNSDQDTWPEADVGPFQYLGYEIDDQQRPVFRFRWKEATLLDQLTPIDRQLQRHLQLEGQTTQTLWHRLATGRHIVHLNNDLYRIDGNYYIHSESPLTLRQLGDNQELVADLTNLPNRSLTYNILW